MRLLHIDTGREMRGGQRQVLLLMRGLRDAGHDCMLLARATSPLWAAANSADFVVREACLSAVWRESRDATLVHAHDAGAHTLAAVASRSRFVVSRRVAFAVGRSILSRWKYRRATRYLAVSRFVAGEIEAAGIARQKIDVVYDAVETPIEADAWSEENLATENLAVALGTNDPQKGKDLVERAAEIAGIAVRFSKDLMHDLRAASMFVYITRSEGLGSAALLAMGMGIPVIASRVGGLPEIVEDGVTGLLVENDAQEIARAMRRMLQEPELRNALIAQAKKMVAERFTKEQLVAETLRSYGRALAG